jgi:glucosamine kinase
MKYLAVDVGGSSTRAAIVEADGTCVGYGTAGSGNPTSSSAADAVAAIVAATRTATAQAGSTRVGLAAATLGIAGAAGDTGAPLRDELISAGLPDQLTFESDLLAAYYSGSLSAEGYALVAGTGAAAVRVRGGQIEATCDGLGWLLGDGGSGFWIGHRAVLAATSALDNRGPATVLVDLVLAKLGLRRTAERANGGRSLALRQAVDAIYRLRPVELAQFAQLAFEAATDGDDAAVEIIADASEALAATLRAVVVPDIAGPLVLSGSILSRQPSVARSVVRHVDSVDDSQVVTVPDGIVGAAVLALRCGGVPVDETVFGRVQSSLATLR